MRQSPRRENETMKRAGAWLVLMLLTAGWVVAQTQTPGQLTPREQAPAAPEAREVGRGSFPLQLIKALDSSKIKVGDVVELKLAGGFILRDGTKVPDGTKVTGRVVEAKARANGDAVSELSLSFDKIELNKEKELSLKAVVQAVGAGPQEEAPTGASGATMGKNSGAAGWTPTTDVKSGSNTNAVEQAPPTVRPDSTGVMGMRGVQLSGDGTISSSGKSVKLPAGTRLVIRAQMFAS